MILQDRRFKRHLVTDEFSKLEVHCIHSNELKNSTDASGFMYQSSDKNPNKTFSVATLLLLLVLTTAKMQASKRQSGSNLWGWRMCRCLLGLGNLELVCRELSPGHHLHPRPVMPPAFPGEILYFLSPCQWFCHAATVQWPLAWQTWGQRIAHCWEAINNRNRPRTSQNACTVGASAALSRGINVAFSSCFVSVTYDNTNELQFIHQHSHKLLQLPSSPSSHQI